MTSIRKLWVSLPVAFIVLGWSWVEAKLRTVALSAHRLGTGNVLKWWITLSLLYLTAFVMTAFVIVLLLRSVSRRVHQFLIVSCVAHALTIWLLYGLAAATGDPIALPQLQAIGLGRLHLWLWVLASLWWLYLLYFLFETIDKSSIK